MKCAAYINDEGNLSIVVPALGIVADQAFFAGEIAKAPEYQKKAPPAFTVIEDSTIPVDRTFRNAWKLNGAAIDHDMTKAREIQRERVRRLGGPPTHPSINAAATIAQLKIAGPAELVAKLRTLK